MVKSRKDASTTSGIWICYFRKLQQHTVKKIGCTFFFRLRRFFYLFIRKSELLYRAKIYTTQSSEKIILLFNLKECYQSYTQEPLIYNVYRLLSYCLISYLEYELKNSVVLWNYYLIVRSQFIYRIFSKAASRFVLTTPKRLKLKGSTVHGNKNKLEIKGTMWNEAKRRGRCKDLCWQCSEEQMLVVQNIGV